MSKQLRVGIIADFNRFSHSHWATEASLFHAASRLRIEVEPKWIPTEAVDVPGSSTKLDNFDGLWGGTGSPYTSFTGMLRGIEFARKNDRPYLGTCGGFQYALIEYTRNVLGIADADTAENNSGSKNIVTTPVACALPSSGPGKPKMFGGETVYPVHGTVIDRLCGSNELAGEYFCNFETNVEFLPKWEAAGLRVAARGPKGEMRAFDLEGNRFFLATLFQPQVSSTPQKPHPIIEGFLRACAIS